MTQSGHRPVISDGRLRGKFTSIPHIVATKGTFAKKLSSSMERRCE